MWPGVRLDERRVKSGSMVYHAICERLKPLVRPVLSRLSANIPDGTLDRSHDVGVEISIRLFACSKSSM